MAPCLLPKISGVEVTPSVTFVESSEQVCCEIHQICRNCEPCVRKLVILLCEKTKRANRCILYGCEEIRQLPGFVINIY